MALEKQAQETPLYAASACGQSKRRGEITQWGSVMSYTTASRITQALPGDGSHFQIRAARHLADL
jgi:hypothetical protein